MSSSGEESGDRGQPESGDDRDIKSGNLNLKPAVLLIDDNAVQAMVRQTVLKRSGYSVFAAFNPELALHQLNAGELSIPVSLVITDHLMPGMTGSAFVRELRKTFPDIPVLVISGLEEAEIEYEGLGVTFRMKPLMPETFLKTVSDLIQPGA